ncbi:hypothetical protein HDU97_003334 [Phlyctochytrium planicorne]|nr:hypothetical protein HDU97_003334 [Phlyctochytrium planicorne]
MTSALPVSDPPNPALAVQFVNITRAQTSTIKDSPVPCTNTTIDGCVTDDLNFALQLCIGAPDCGCVVCRPNGNRDCRISFGVSNLVYDSDSYGHIAFVPLNRKVSFLGNSPVSYNQSAALTITQDTTADDNRSSVTLFLYGLIFVFAITLTAGWFWRQKPRKIYYDDDIESPPPTRIIHIRTQPPPPAINEFDYVPPYEEVPSDPNLALPKPAAAKTDTAFEDIPLHDLNAKKDGADGDLSLQQLEGASASTGGARVVEVKGRKDGEVV